VFYWLGSDRDSLADGYRFRGVQSDYYSLLVRGFSRDQLSLPFTPAIYRFARADGTVPDRMRAPLDTSYYKGRVYLYFGVVPAVLVLLPYHLLTGDDLSLNVPTLAFTALGFLVSLRWYWRLRRTHFMRAALAADACAVLALAFAPATVFLVRRSMFYELPLAAGYAFLMIMLSELENGLNRERGALRSIAIASAAWGLAVGCHPTYLFLAPLLLVSAWVLGRRRPPGRDTINAIRLVGAAALPAAVIGFGLACYNYARFESIFEFGFNYQANSIFFNGAALRSLAFVPANVRWYYFTPPSLMPYFPFVFPANASFRPPGYYGFEAMHGQFLVILWVAWSVGGALLLAGKQLGRPGITRPLLLLTASYLVSACLIFPLGFRANRYLADFQAPLVFGAVLLAAAGSHYGPRGALSRFWHFGCLVLCMIAAVDNIAASIQQFDSFKYTRPGSFARLSRALNPSWAFWDRHGLVKSGVVSFDVTFAAQRETVNEPLLTTGTPFYSDAVYVEQDRGGDVQLFVDHLGYGGPKGEHLHYDLTHSHHVECELGSFLPPLTDPCFDEIIPGSAKSLKSIARIKVDGATVIDGSMEFYDSAPWLRLFGENPLTWTVFSEHFSGGIKSVRWTPSVKMESRRSSVRNQAWLRLKGGVPTDGAAAGGQPLLVTGSTGNGALLLLDRIGTSRWEAAVDEWNYGASRSPSFEMADGQHLFDILIGPSVADDPIWIGTEAAGLASPYKDRLLVWIDARLVANLRLVHYRDEFKQASIGSNREGFSTARSEFSGDLERIAVAPNEAAGLLKLVGSTSN